MRELEDPLQVCKELSCKIEHSFLTNADMDPPERTELGYSLKNVPMPSEKCYRKKLIGKVESVIKRMRWKAFFFLEGKADVKEETKHFGFRSPKTPPQVPELKAFEEDLLSLVAGVKFRRVADPFQTKLRDDIKNLTSTDDVIVRADKTKNLYKVSKQQYDKLLQDNVTKNYKLAPESAYAEVNLEAKRIAEKLDISDRVDRMASAEAFITLKDHKDRFSDSLPCRLINPAKSELGAVSKSVLDRIVGAVKQATNINLWKNTAAVIDWFNGIPGKQQHTFVCFDVVEFYPSITASLLKKALDFAEQYVKISDEEREIIMHARKSILFKGDRQWVKKGTTDDMFDVTMGSFDGAEICELVGAFVLNQLAEVADRATMGLYRDDGLAVLKSTTGGDAERMRKKIISVFKQNDLRVTIDVNLKSVNFLDVTFNLSTGRFMPYRKPNDTPLYVNARSNHPPSIIKQIPTAISKRISSISSDEDAFNTAAPMYNNALSASGYLSNIEYNQVTHEGKGKRKKNRKRKIIWFNPPFSRNVETNIAAGFLKLIDRHFKNTPLSKIFNRNNTKVSYSCMPNVAAIISSHNKRLLAQNDPEKPCNCRRKPECPLDGRCQASGIVYEATVSCLNETKTYTGLTETPFKVRYANHTLSFRNDRYRNSTELSKHLWQLKEKGQDSTITWAIKDTARPYNSATKTCNLCLTEKYWIISADKTKSLNKRSELVSTCRHAAKHRLANFTGIT